MAEPAARLLLNRGNRPTRLWAALSGDVAIGDYLPTLTHASERDARLALVWLVALGLLLALDRLAQGRPRVDALLRQLRGPVVVLLLVVRGRSGRGPARAGRTARMRTSPAEPAGAATAALRGAVCGAEFSAGLGGARISSTAGGASAPSRRAAVGSPGRSAVSRTSSIDETSRIFRSRLTFSGMSSLTAFSLRFGSRTSLTPRRCAASTFSLMPPTGEHAARERHLAGHRHARAHRAAGQQRDDRGRRA